jgi:photosystem II stability/assembly factor-like uncharacterized protein
MRANQLGDTFRVEQSHVARPRQWRWRVAAARAVLLGTVLLNACGGDGPEPSPLPDQVSILAPTQAEPGAPVGFDSSLFRNASGLSLRWSFGDGQSSTEAAPRHRYAAPGRYSVALEVSDGSGLTRSARAEILVGRFSMVEGLDCSGVSGTGWCLQWPRDRRHDELLIENASIGWGVGQDGQLYRTDETTATWQLVDLGLPLRRIHAVRFADARVGWALGVADDPPDHAGSRGVLLAKTMDGGRSWIRHSLPDGWTPADVETADLQVLDPRRVLVHARTSSPNLVSSDGGERWALARYKNLVFARTGTSAWVRTVNTAPAPVLLRSVDLGVSVINAPPSLLLPHGAISNLQFVDDRHGWLTQETRAANGLAGDALWITKDGGASWSMPGAAEPRHPLQYFASMVMLDQRHGYRTFSWSNLGRGGGDTFSSTADGGLTWTHSDFLPTNACGGGFFHLGGTEFWKSRGSCPVSTATRPFIEMSNNLGQTWRQVPIPADPTTLWPAVRDADRALRLRFADVTHRSNDDGDSWQAIKTWPFKAPLPKVDSRNALAFRTSTVGAAVVAGGATLVTEDAGKTWRPGQTPAGSLFSSGKTRAAARGRWQFVGDDLWLMGNNQLWNAAAPDAAWTNARFRMPASANFVDARRDDMRDMHFVDAQVGFALKEGLDDASLVLSTSDGGQTEWRADTITGLTGLALHFTDRQRGLVVGKAGAIAQTTDGGRTWTLRASGTTADLHAVHQVSASLAIAAGARGTVLVSRDGGTSWQRAALDSAFDWQRVHFSNALNGWIVGDFGSVAHTGDGGQTWQMQRSATGEHLVDVFALDAGTAWAVSNRGMVFATASGGR